MLADWYPVAALILTVIGATNVACFKGSITIASSQGRALDLAGLYINVNLCRQPSGYALYTRPTMTKSIAV